jgi:hypothetical protein
METDVAYTEENPEDIKLIENLTQNLMVYSSKISLQRADIISQQRLLLDTLEPTIFHLLSETKDDWMKTTVTKVWSDHLLKINEMISIHGEMVKEFETIYTKLNDLKPAYEI